MPSLNKHSIKTYNYRKYTLTIIFIAIIAVLGVIILNSSHASVPYASIEASTGALTGSASTVSDGNASNGSYVQFGSVSSGTTASGCTSGSEPAPCVGSTTTGVSGWGTPTFDDEFNGTSIDTNSSCSNGATDGWNTESGWNKNGITVSTSDEAESGGNLVLTLSSYTNGAEISTNCYTLPVGGFAEARVAFPGNGTTIYNWPAWWTAGTGWPATGEYDIFEGLGNATANYHYAASGCTITDSNDCDAQAGPFNIPGTWSSSNSSSPTFHIFGLYRGAGYTDIYWDGVLVKDFTTHDYVSGGNTTMGEQLILTNGCSGGSGSDHGCTDGAQVKVDYARAWSSNSSGWTGTAP